MSSENVEISKESSIDSLEKQNPVSSSAENLHEVNENINCDPQNYQGTINILRKEIERAWKIADAANRREQDKDESLEGLRKKYDALVKVTKKPDITLEPDEVVGLGKYKDVVVLECERLTVEAVELQKRMLIQRNYSDELTKKLIESENQFKDLYKKLDDIFQDSYKDKTELKTLKILHETLLEEKVKLEDGLQYHMERSDQFSKELKQTEEKLVNVRDDLTKKKAENLLNIESSKICQSELASLKVAKKEIAFELKQTKIALSVNVDSKKKLVLENQKKVKEIESLSRKVILVENSKSSLQQEALILKNDKITVEKERDLSNKFNDEQKKKIDELLKNIDVVKKEFEKSGKTIEEYKDIKTYLEASTLQLKKEIRKLLLIDKKSKSIIRTISKRAQQTLLDLEYEKEKVEIVKTEVIAKEEIIEDFKRTEEIHVEDMKKISSDFSNCMKENKEISLARNAFATKVEDFKDRWTKAKSQVENLTESLTFKNKEVVLLSREKRKLEDNIQEYQRNSEKLEGSLKNFQEENTELRLENKKHKEALRENNEKLVSQKTELLKVLREKDLVHSQMVSKTEESTLLRRENDLLKINVDKANLFINQKLHDIHVLSTEVKNLQVQCNVLKTKLDRALRMRHEVLQLHRKLTQERSKATALAEVMNSPQNIHRWRKLGCMDPSKMDLIFKYQMMTKRLLVKTNKLIKIEKIVESYHKKFEILKQTIVNKPNHEVLVKLNKARSQLTQNTKKMKSAVAISRANFNDLSLKDQTIEQLQRDIAGLKNEIFEKKKENSKLQDVLKPPSKKSLFTNQRKVV